MFQDAVTNGRGDRLKKGKVNPLSGHTYVATLAHEYGLVDGIKPFEQIIEDVQASVTKQTTSQKPKNSTSMKWPKILAFLNMGAAAAAGDIKLDDTQADSLENLVVERDTLKTEKATLETEKSNLTAQVATLTQQLTAANTAKTNAETALATANNRITELEAEDGTPGAQGTPEDKDKFPGKNSDDLSQFMTDYDREKAAYKS
jgi:septal ring factor EnvC (AmiA/AmiB activator)